LRLCVEIPKTMPDTEKSDQKLTRSETITALSHY
jgi:hypothetical protein